MLGCLLDFGCIDVVNIVEFWGFDMNYLQPKN